MKIAFIGQKGIPVKFGGVERHVDDLSTRLAYLGHEVYVYTRLNYTPAELEEYQGVKLISLPSIATKNLDAITHTFRACLDIAKRDVDIIHFHSIGPSSLIWLVKLLKPGTPIVATFHDRCYFHKKWGSFARLYLKFGELICCNLADQTITVSKTLQQYAENKYKKPITYIPNGANINKVESDSLIKRWGLSKGNYIIVVSRLVKHKGIHHLIEAFKKIETDKKLVIVGDGAYTDKYVDCLKESAQSDPKIIFLGNQTGDTLAQLFANTYLFVQPSESEGLSIALLEAMAYEKAALVSDIPQNLEAIGEHGLTFRSKSIVDLREQIVELLKYPDLVAKNAALNKKRIEEYYNWDKIVLDIIKVYEQLLAQRAEKKKKFLRLRLLGRFVGLLF